MGRVNIRLTLFKFKLTLFNNVKIAFFQRQAKTNETSIIDWPKRTDGEQGVHLSCFRSMKNSKYLKE